MGTPPPPPPSPPAQKPLTKKKGEGGREGVSPADEGPIQILFLSFWTLPSHTMMNGNSLGEKFFFRRRDEKENWEIGRRRGPPPPTHSLLRFCPPAERLRGNRRPFCPAQLFCPRHFDFFACNIVVLLLLLSLQCPGKGAFTSRAKKKCSTKESCTI